MREMALPQASINYALMQREDGSYQIRVTAPSVTPVVVGRFRTEQEAQAWIDVGCLPQKDPA
ncbi:MAG: hypothetical protein QOK29_3907 [Rhodospirillaceae bacterium]|nr:hypothetical protein [Rhodospirillaceae bacterium]